MLRLRGAVGRCQRIEWFFDSKPEGFTFHVVPLRNPLFLHFEFAWQVKIIIMDSVAFHFRRGFDDFSLRSRLLKGMNQSLMELANKFGLAVVVINQVTTKMRNKGTGGSLIAPALGKPLLHLHSGTIAVIFSLSLSV